MWRKLVDITMSQNQKNYQRLNVTLTKDDVMGESLYNSMLPGIVADLKAKGLAVESEGATVVFLDEYKTKTVNLWALSSRKGWRLPVYHHRYRLCEIPLRNAGRRPRALLHRFPSAPAFDAGMDYRA